MIGSRWRFAPEWQYLENNVLAYLPFDAPQYNAPQSTFLGSYADLKGRLPTVANPDGSVFRPGIPRADGRQGYSWQRHGIVGTSTNLITNPSFEAGSYSPWGITASGTTVTVTNEYSVYGSHSVRCDCDNTAPYQGIQFEYIPVTAGLSYTGSAHVLSNISDGIIHLGIAFLDSSHALLAINLTTCSVNSSEFKRFFVTGTAPTGSVTAILYVYRLPSLPSSSWTMWMDAAQFEQSSYCTNYFDGSLGYGYAWTGTPHASTSTRTVTGGIIYYHTSRYLSGLDKRGTISVWAYNDSNLYKGSFSYIFRLYDGSGHIYVLKNSVPYTDRYRFAWGATALSASLPITYDKWQHICLTNDGTTIKVYLDGVLAITDVYDKSLSNTLYLLFDQKYGAQIDDVLVLDTPLSGDEVRSLYRYGKAIGMYEDTDCRQETIYLSNKHNHTNITHAYYRSNSGTWSGNLLTTPLPSYLMPTSPAAGDALYLGMDTGTNREMLLSACLDNVYIDLFNYVGYSTLAYEYWNGSSWASLPSVDDYTGYTGKLLYSGLVMFNNVLWSPVALSTAVAGAPASAPIGLWFRLRVTSVGSGTPPTMVSYPYFVGKPYFDICSDSVQGDIEALLKLVMGFYHNVLNGFAIGARSLLRGADFEAFLNFAPYNNPTYIEPYILTTLYSAGYVWGGFSGGYCFNLSSVGTVSSPTEVFKFRIASPNYSGKYNLYMRGRAQSAVNLDVRFSLRTYNNMMSYEVPFVYTEWQTLNSSTTYYQVLDFGTIDFPKAPNVEGFDLTMEIKKSSSTSANYDFVDVILIPADEMVILAKPVSSYSLGYYAVFDSAENQRDTLSGYLRDSSFDTIARLFEVYSRKQFSAFPRVPIRFWVFGNVTTSYIEQCTSIDLSGVQRYLLARGER